MAFEVGQRVGDYEIVQLLGVGGMGHVYRVRNVISDRTEAMKVLLPDLTAERDLAIRFISEIRTLASFDHPNIALLHTAFQSDNQLIMMMEFVEGATLEQRARQGAMTVADVAGYTNQTLSALSYAHGRGVVHRDIKPANIMLTSYGVVKLMDFGIAKSKVETHLTRPGTTIGSLYYMSPEQVRGDTVDGRSDLYSVGIMLYELLAGRRPFEADTTFSILNQQLNTAPQPPIELNPALPRLLNDIILRSLAKSPAARFQTADEFRAALRPFCTAPANEKGHGATAAIPGNAAAAIAAGDGAPAATATYASPPPLSEPQPFHPATSSAMHPPPAFVDVPGNPPPPPPGSSPLPSSPSQKSRRSLWIATGVAAALLAMIGLGIGLPRILGTHAAESQQPEPAPAQSLTPTHPLQAQSGPATPAGDHPGVGTAPSSPLATGAASQQHTPPVENNEKSSPGAKRPPYISSVPANTASANDSSAPSNAAQGGAAAQLNQVREHFNDLSARAGAVESSLSHLRRQQEAEGYGLRGDVETASNRLQNNLRAADQDLRYGSGEAAGKHLDQAEGDLSILEKFLGR